MLPKQWSILRTCLLFSFPLHHGKLGALPQEAQMLWEAAPVTTAHIPVNGRKVSAEYRGIPIKTRLLLRRDVVYIA